LFADFGGAQRDSVVIEWSTQSPANSGNNRPFVDHPTCPRKPEMAGNRKCLKKCRSDMECRGRSRRCFCDDVCGKSCVRPSRLKQYIYRKLLKSTDRHRYHEVYCIDQFGF